MQVAVSWQYDEWCSRGVVLVRKCARHQGGPSGACRAYMYLGLGTCILRVVIALGLGSCVYHVVGADVPGGL